ncbi:MAG: DNA alkylation repair protein [Vicinamibacterales bacterium]
MDGQDNPNAFKHQVGPALLARLGTAIHAVHPAFRARDLEHVAPALASLELKDRVRLVRATLRDLLPAPYSQAVAILVAASHAEDLRSFDFWPLTDFVEAYGLEDFEASMDALHWLTQRFTGEFAIRPFLREESERTFSRLRRWTRDPNAHVRRLVSEGTRPRLPWGLRVPALIADPEAGLALLERLKHDPEEYVRKSVANHLNDISKDHPARVIEVLTAWRAAAQGEDSGRVEWITRHALRTLIKKGDPRALAVIGAQGKARVRATALTLARRRLAVGDTLEFSVALASTAREPQKVVVDYRIGFRNARGGTSTRVFKLKTFTLPARGTVTLTKRHSLKPITTRVYYAGAHRLDVQVNGRVIAGEDWTLRTQGR